MSERFSRKLDVVTNLAILVAVSITIFIFINHYFGSANRAAEPKNLAGTKINLPDINWSENKQTIVLALQKGCHFCEESANFYQRLVQEVSASNDAKVIATFPQPVEESKAYLKDLNILLSEVIQSGPSSLGAKGTPTVFLVDSKGVILDVWRGKLPPEKELEILVKLRKCRVFAECG